MLEMPRISRVKFFLVVLVESPSVKSIEKFFLLDTSEEVSTTCSPSSEGEVGEKANVWRERNICCTCRKAFSNAFWRNMPTEKTMISIKC